MKNGALLAAAEEAGFDCFITADQELNYQQNLTHRNMAILVLSTNNWDLIKAGIVEITTAIGGWPQSHPPSAPNAGAPGPSHLGTGGWQ